MRTSVRTLMRGRDTIALAEALEWLAAQSRKGISTLPRCAAYRLAHETLRDLAHKEDLSDVTVEKFDALVRDCASRTGWIEGAKPVVLRECTSCQEQRPEDEFRRVATAAERVNFGWRTFGSRRYVMDAWCWQCRRNAAKRRAYQHAKKWDAVPLLQMERYLKNKAKEAGKAHTRSRIVYGEASPITTFHAVRARCAAAALQTVQRRLAHTQPHPTPVPDPQYWYDLLSDDERRALFEARDALPRRQGRPVSL